MFLTIGTDCSGIDAPIEALRQLVQELGPALSYEHLWSCEIDKYAKQSIIANHSPRIFYDDMLTRDHSQLPDVQLYSAGFPCQSFSLLGNRQGTNDSRSSLVKSPLTECLKVIELKKPKVFILENVANFKTIQNNEPYNFVMNKLKQLDYYNIYDDIYNTKNYGIPQQRRRLYIIGISKEYNTPYTKPQHQPLKDIKDFILDTTVYPLTTTNKVILSKLNKTHPRTKETNQQFHKFNVITASNFDNSLENICPTLTHQCSSFYLPKYNRRLSIEECLLLQGFNPNTFKIVVSKTQLSKQIGNSMSVNVLKAIFKEIFKVILS